MISAKYLDLLIWIVLILVALASVALEKTKKRLSRKQFFLCVLSAICWTGLLGVLADTSSGLLSDLILIPLTLLLIFAFYRAVARRSNDTGYGKWPAYAAVIPWLNYLCVLILLALPSKSEGEDGPPSDVGSARESSEGD